MTNESMRSVMSKVADIKNAAHSNAKVSSLLAEIARLDHVSALTRMESQCSGLSEIEVAKRLEKYGPNLIASEERKSAVRQLLDQLLNPLNMLLVVLILLNFFVLDDFESGCIVSGIIGISVLLSFFQEHRSSHAAEKLRAMVSTTATVLRPSALVPDAADHEDEKMEVPIGQLVPGDVICLAAGDIIPADVRILSARDLFLNQSALTGEALPVEKFPDLSNASASNPLEFSNLCFMGSNVTSGSAKAIVVHTGAQTYFGSIAHAIVGKHVETGFEKGVTRFTWLMIKFMLVMVPLVFLINGLTKGDWMQAFIFATAVAVGLTPEMLPMIVTVNLSKGALTMSRKKVIVKRLNAIQNFGAMDVLCTDKTGTLTQDKIIMKRHIDLMGDDCDEVLNYAYLNSHYQSGLKNLLDVAVLEHSEVLEALQPDTAYSKIDEIPFDFERRRMSVVVGKKATNEHILICKGAVEEVLSACSQCEIGGKVGAYDATHREMITDLAKELNEDGFRVVAVAYKVMPPAQAVYAVKDENELTLIGFIAFLDPPKDSAAQAIRALEDGGVVVKVLTGDNDIVTRKVCRDVNLDVQEVLLGSAIENMSDDELARVVDQTTVFAKLSPAQKARVISALHKNGHVVGFMGDGINDGPALKMADISISVDTAVDIAKESADIILLEKSLLVLQEGVLEGRRVFSNITKYIKMGASSNFGNMFSVLGASAWLPFLPMAPVQVLVNNLLYDFSQTAIPTDHVDEEFLAKPRQWNIGNIAKFMLALGPISSVFDYLTFALLYFVLGANDMAHASLFQTGWFVESILSQTLIVHVIRTNRIPFLESRASLPLILTSLLICTIGIWLPFSAFAANFGFTMLPQLYWLVLAPLLLGYLMLAHLAKAMFIKRFGDV